MITNYYHIFFKNFTFSRFLNLFLTSISYFFSMLVKEPYVWGKPPKVMIEPTNYCNLKCPLCPSGAGKLTRDRGYMSFDLYKRIIDQIQNHCFIIYLWNQGEPFLHTDIIKMIKYAHKKKISVVISSNANILPNPKDLVESGIDSIVISLDGTTQETYNKYRINGLIEKVYYNVKMLKSTRDHLKKSYPKIICQFIAMKHNEHELESFKSLDIGSDKKILLSVQIYSQDEIKKFLPKNTKYNRYKIKSHNFEMKIKIKNKCHRLWYQPVINWDGSISICCFDKDNIYKIGSVMQNTFSDLWTSSQYNNFRRIILRNRKTIEICTNCDEGL